MSKFSDFAKANPLGLPDFRKAAAAPKRSYAAASVVDRAYSAAAGSKLPYFLSFSLIRGHHGVGGSHADSLHS